MELKFLVISSGNIALDASASSAPPVAIPRTAVCVSTYLQRQTTHAGAPFLALPRVLAVGVCPPCRCCAARHPIYSLDRKISTSCASVYDHLSFAATIISAFNSHDLETYP